MPDMVTSPLDVLGSSKGNTPRNPLPPGPDVGRLHGPCSTGIESQTSQKLHPSSKSAAKLTEAQVPTRSLFPALLLTMLRAPWQYGSGNHAPRPVLKLDRGKGEEIGPKKKRHCIRARLSPGVLSCDQFDSSAPAKTNSSPSARARWQREGPTRSKVTKVGWAFGKGELKRRKRGIGSRRL